MRLAKLARLAALCCGVTATAAYGQSPMAIGDGGSYLPVESNGYYPPVEGEVVIENGSYPFAVEADGQACQSGCDTCSSCQCDGNGILIDGLCSSCGCGSELGDPFRVFGHCNNFRISGWSQFGYHDQNLLAFNNRKNDLQWQQAWLYAEKGLDDCGCGFGGRIDYLYGTDAPDTQAFGIDNDHWDNDWDNGPDYGHALPQAYVTVGNSNFNIKAGKFFTIIGYEVVAAPDNFFYSHAYTFNFSEPFTHTGALATLSCGENVELYGGWVLGWDSGFEDNGDAYLGGGSYQLTDEIKVNSTSVVGRFADNLSTIEKGYMHSTVVQVKLSEQLQYIFQNDWLDTDDENDVLFRETVGINQYLIHTINDRLALGARMEWWQVDGASRGYLGDLAPPNQVIPGNFNIYDLTLGLNYRPCANAVIRPEIRWDWVYGDRQALGATGLEILEDNDNQQTTFGVDAILLF
jgi:hypothetical protein